MQEVHHSHRGYRTTVDWSTAEPKRSFFKGFQTRTRIRSQFRGRFLLLRTSQSLFSFNDDSEIDLVYTAFQIHQADCKLFYSGVLRMWHASILCITSSLCFMLHINDFACGVWSGCILISVSNIKKKKKKKKGGNNVWKGASNGATVALQRCPGLQILFSGCKKTCWCRRQQTWAPHEFSENTNFQSETVVLIHIAVVINDVTRPWC